MSSHELPVPFPPLVHFSPSVGDLETDFSGRINTKWTPSTLNDAG
jgi:hypothetical protein